jgi:hypothetical protein
MAPGGALVVHCTKSLAIRFLCELNYIPDARVNLKKAANSQISLSFSPLFGRL